mgnify:CR=1 FL=1
MNKTTVEIDLGKNSYDIKIGNNLFEENTFTKFLKHKEVMLIYDQNLDTKEINNINHFLDKSGVAVKVDLGIKATEKNKSYKSLSQIQDLLIENRFSRECLLIGFGGGIICDLTGFAAATYQRGVDFILIPTSLLAQIDASVGGKTGINHPQGKNMIGSFHQPKLVLIETNYLSTLPEREVRCGLVEMIKHGLIVDKYYFNWLEKNIDSILELEEPIITEAIKRSVEIKSNIVSMDEKESGIRALLNFGHTYGHALELIGNYEDYKHGEAVALGIKAALKLSEMMGHLTEEDLKRINTLFVKAGINTKTIKKINSEELYSAMQLDKKKQGKNLNFIVLEEIGKAIKVDNLSKEKVLESIERSLFPH